MVENREATGSTVRRAADWIRSNENFGRVLALVGLIGISGAVSNGASLRLANIQNVLTQSSIRGITALGQAFVILASGIDISVTGVALTSATLGAALTTTSRALGITGGNPLPLAAVLPIMVLTGIGLGAVNGTLVARTGMPAFIVTFAMWRITGGLAYQMAQGQSITFLPKGFEFLGLGTILGVPVPIIIFFAIAATAYFVLQYTTYGRYVYAIGTSPTSAWLCGINEPLIRQSVFMVSGFLASISGILITGRIMSVSWRTLRGLEFDTISACAVGGLSLLGGIGSIIGVVLGVLIIGVTNNLLNLIRASESIRLIVKGSIVIGAVAVDYIR